MDHRNLYIVYCLKSWYIDYLKFVYCILPYEICILVYWLSWNLYIVAKGNCFQENFRRYRGKSSHQLQFTFQIMWMCLLNFAAYFIQHVYQTDFRMCFCKDVGSDSTCLRYTLSMGTFVWKECERVPMVHPSVHAPLGSSSYVNMSENRRWKCTHIAEVINHKIRPFSGPFLNQSRIHITVKSIPSSYLYLREMPGERHIMCVKSVAKCTPFALKRFLKIVPFLSNYCRKDTLFADLRRSVPDSEKRTLFCVFVFTHVNTHD